MHNPLRRLFRKPPPGRRTRRRKRLLVSEMLEQRQLLAGDVQIRFAFTDTNQTPVSSLSVGDEFLVHAYVQDVQTSPDGLFRAYFDLNYDSALVTASDPITHGPSYNLAPDGNTQTAGQIDEVGGTDSDTVPPSNRGAEFLLFSVPFTAEALGTLTLSIDPADTPSRAIQLFDLRQIPADQVALVGASIEITSGVVLTPTSGLQTTEAGGSATFTAVLTTPPTANVSFSLTSSDPSEGTVSLSNVLFTPTNWNQSQTITVTGVDDLQDDGNVAYNIVTGTLSSADPRFSNATVPDISVTNIDNDTAAVLVSPASGLVTSEVGGTATFEVVLASQPVANVTVGLSSSDTSEGTLSPSSLLFTNSNWNVPQTVVVTGVDDLVDDGDIAYTIVTAAAVSSDPGYNGLNGNDVSVTNANNDSAGITVQPISGLTTTEAGGSQTFSVRLDSQPTADVIIGISSSDTSEGTVSTSSLTFTAANWNVPKIVTVTGVDDALDDGNQTYQVLTAAATSTDPRYSGRSAADVTVVNVNDDSRGFTVSPLSGLSTTEAGGTDSFSVRLNSQPTGSVTLGVSVSDSSEGSLNVTSLVFTPDNWQTPQSVVVTGLDDAIDDGDISHNVVFAAAVSTDPQYANQTLSNISVTNIDNDTRGITVAPTSGLVTSESGATASFTVVLTSAPTAPVTIGLSSSDTTEGTVSHSSLTFTAANWNAPQTVTVSGVDDSAVDGNVAYAIFTAPAVSADPLYNNRVVADVSVTNTDDDVAGVMVAPTSGLVTNEAGQAATFTLQLTARPSSNVTISLASSDPSEGTVSAPSVTFTPANWNTAQQITVTGVDDFIADQDVAYQILTGATQSSDAAFNGLAVDDVSVTNADDDIAQIIVEPIDGLIVSEAGQSDSFQVRLGSQPAANVTVGIQSSDTTEGTVSATSLVFTPQNWDTPQTVIVTGQDDLIDDGNVTFTILTAAALSQDEVYDGLNAADVSATNNNDDTAGIVIEPLTGLQTTESGSSATFTIVLTSQPTSDVTIGLASSDPSEGTLNVGSVVFGTTNWNTPQTVTITGVDDLVDDDNIGYSIVTSPADSADAGYSAMDAPDVLVTNIDDDVPGIAIVPTAGLVTSEAGQAATFEIVLTSQPTDDVTIGLTSSEPSEGTVSVSSVTFTPNNWDTPQGVDIQGVDDAIVDGSVAYAIVTAAAISADPVFSDIDPSDVAVVNQDDDSAVLTVTPVSIEEGSAGGQTQFVFDVTLSTAVASGFSVDFLTADGTAVAADGDYVASDGTLQFSGNSGEVQTITVLVNRDTVVEAAETFSVSLSNLAGISDSLAERMTLPSTSTLGTILNDDVATLTIVGPAATLEGTADTATSLSFTVQLSAAVQDGFTIAYSTSDGTAQLSDGDYTDNDGVLTFLGTAGETQTINVLVNADDRVEPDETLSVTLASPAGLPATAADDVDVAIPSADATILNDDFPRLLFSEITANPIEGSGGATTEFRFQVTLTDAVEDADGFDVPFTTSDGTATVAGGDYQASSGTLHFAGTAGEVKTVSVFVNQDSIVEADETFQVTLADIVGLETGQTVVVPVDTRQATIQDDDTANLVLTVLPISQAEGATYELSVSLSAQVQDGFSVDYATSDATATVADGDYLPLSGTLTFAGLANERQTFSVASQQDAKVERDEVFQIALQALAGLPAGVADSITVSSPLSLTILNDDSATVTLSSPTAINEGDAGSSTELEFQVTLSAPVDQGFSVDFRSVNATADAGSDYIGVEDTLVFSGNNAETQIIRVLVQGDDIVEANETFQVRLGQLSGLLAGLENDVVIQNNIAGTTILNDDTATLSITGPGALNEGSSGNVTDFVFTVTLSAAVQDGLTVAFDTQDGTATVADNDFQRRTGTLTFAGTAGESHTVSVAVSADERVESDEDFTLSLAAIGGLPPTAVDAVSIAQPTATATILNDDFPRLVLTDITQSASEGTSADGFTEFQFTVMLTDAVNDPDGFQVPVNIQDGSATVADGDYQATDTLLQFSGTAMETKTITVLVRQDAILENDETFSVGLGEIVGLAAGQTVLREVDSLTATIQDDDSATLTLSAASPSANEGDGGTTSYTFDVSLSAAVQGGFSVAHRTNDQTATLADGDYVDNDATLNFMGTANESQQVVVLVNGDQVVEGDESFEFTIGPINGLDTDALQRLTIVNPAVIATIVNDDAATLTISGPGSLVEGTGTGTTAYDYTVTLSHAVASGFTLSYQTLDGTATLADGDYVDNDGSLAFAGTAGETQSIRVLVNRDARVEANETFRVTLGQVSGLDAALADQLTVDTTPVVATIANDDVATIGFVNGTSGVLEADGQHSVAVRLQVAGGGTLSEAVTVNVTVRDGGTASAGDFSLTTTSIVFPAGSADGATRSVQLGLIEDNLVEDVETIVLGLALASNTLSAVSLASPAIHTISVTDDAMDAVLSGRVWVDANNDGLLNIGEWTLPAVSIRLTGTTLGGETINRSLLTDSNGLYKFLNLPAGTYSIIQTQPAELTDGRDVLGTVNGVASGSVAADRFDGIVVRPSQQGSGYHFGESGLQAAQVSRFRFLSRPRPGGLFGNPVTSEMLASASATSASATSVSGAPQAAQGERAATNSSSVPLSEHRDAAAVDEVLQLDSDWLRDLRQKGL